LKLLLLGKTESEGFEEPWPVELPGESKPLSSAKIGEYINSELFYYYRFYINTRHCGSPLLPGWTEWPAWVPQLITYFDNTIEIVQRYNERKAYRQRG